MPKDVARGRQQPPPPDTGSTGLRMLAGIVTFLAVLWTFGGPMVTVFGKPEVVAEVVLWVAAVTLWVLVFLRQRRINSAAARGPVRRR